ncbi:MAG: RusA family crossover junction endodeoxyribonuclease [Bacillota bacterium]|nr:RusA family crossover junction endodeoxyribonuclease [Bacillota bacterium]
MTFEIIGKVQGKGRPKFARRGNYVTTYTPEQTANYENWVKLCYQQQGGKMFDGTKPLKIEVYALFEIPKSFTKGKRLAAEHNIIRPTVKPDWDNIGKIVADSLNGIAYKDDVQIVDGGVKKYFTCREARVIAEIKEIDTSENQWTDKEAKNCK